MSQGIETRMIWQRSCFAVPQRWQGTAWQIKHMHMNTFLVHCFWNALFLLFMTQSPSRKIKLASDHNINQNPTSK